MLCKNGEHELRTPADRHGDTECRQCWKRRQHSYRSRQKLGMALLRAAETRGLSGGEAIALLQNADYWTLQECQSIGKPRKLTKESILEISLGAAIAYANGEIDSIHYWRTLAVCTLRAEGIQRPTIEQIENRISELNTAMSFISGGVGGIEPKGNT